MFPPFTARTIAIETLLGGGHRLTVPDYQRSYAWSPVEAGQLLDDVLLTIGETGDTARWSTSEVGDDDDAYFLGAVVCVERRDQSKREGAPVADWEIVDGLQRIVTLTIILAVARDLMVGEDDEVAGLAARAIGTGPAGGSDGFRLQMAANQSSFLARFVQMPGASTEMPDEDSFTEADQRILDVREYVAERLLDLSANEVSRLVHFLLGRCYCALIATSSIDRAHRIFTVLNDRGRPLSRSDILKAQILGAIPAEQRSGYSAVWRDIEQRLGGSLDELLGYIRVIEGLNRHRIIDDLRAIVTRAGGAEVFIDELLVPHGSALAAFKAISLTYERGGSQSPLERSLASRLDYLGWLGTHDWVPAAMLWWQRTGNSVDALDAFLARLDRLAFAMRLLGLGADKRVARYQGVMAAIRSGTVAQPGGPLDVSRDEQRLISYNLRNIYSRSQLTCKLLLLRVNDALAGSPQRLDPAHLTVEHILPQKPARNSQWREWFPVAEERERCTQSLGNLILVSRERNERARNSDLSAKLAIYFSGTAGQPHITRDIEGLSEWRPQMVADREARIMSAIDDLWKFAPSGGGGEEAKLAERQDSSAERRRRAQLRKRAGAANG